MAGCLPQACGKGRHGCRYGPVHRHGSSGSRVETLPGPPGKEGLFRRPGCAGPARFHQSGLAEGKSRQRYRDPEAIPEKRQTGSSGADRGTGPCPGRQGRQGMEGYGHSIPFPGCGKGARGGHAASGGIDEGGRTGTGRKAFGGTALQRGSGNSAGGPLRRHEGKNRGREKLPPPAFVRAGQETGQQ